MLTEKKVAAYWPGWREKIQKLQKGDIVFLYQSGTGIIAFGESTGELIKKDYDGHADYEFAMKLNNFQVLKKPLAAAEMKLVTNQGYPFRTTMFSINDSSRDLLLDEIEKNYL